MPPVARKILQYAPGSPEDVVQKAIDARYEGNNERFFLDLGTRLKISQDSASGAFYRAARKDGGLPARHQHAYMALLDLPLTLIEHFGRETEKRYEPDLLEQLREEVAALTKALDVARSEHRKLARRVAALETDASRSPVEAPRRARAKRQGRPAP